MSVKPSARAVAATAKDVASYIKGLEAMGKRISTQLAEDAATVLNIIEARAESFKPIKDAFLDSDARKQWENETVVALIGTPGTGDSSILGRMVNTLENMENTPVGHGHASYSRQRAVQDVRDLMKAERTYTGRRDYGAHAKLNPLVGIAQSVPTPSMPARPSVQMTAMKPAPRTARPATR